MKFCWFAVLAVSLLTANEEFSVSPDKSKIAYLSKDDNLYLIHFPTRVGCELVLEGTPLHVPQWGPDNKTLYGVFKKAENTFLSSKNIENGAYETLVTKPISHFQLAHSGKWIAYQTFEQATVAFPLRESFVPLIIVSSSDPFSWHPKEDKIAYVKEHKIFIKKIEEGKAQLEYENETLQFVAEPLKFTDSGSGLIVGAKTAESDKVEAVLLISLEKEAITEIPLCCGWEFLEILQSSQKNVTALAYQSERQQSAIFNFYFEENGSFGQVLWHSPAIVNAFQNVTDGYLCFYEDSTTPKSLFLVTQDFTSWQPFFSLKSMDSGE